MSGQDLAAFLKAAEALLREKVVAAAQGEARFAGLMVASALGMAARELALDYQLRDAAGNVAGFAPQPSPYADGEEALVHLIRQGLLDGDEDLHRLLLADAAVRTAVTRPQVVSEAERTLAGLD